MNVGSHEDFFGFYKGPEVFSIASAVPASDGIYLSHGALDDSERDGMGVQRLPWSPELTRSR